MGCHPCTNTIASSYTLTLSVLLLKLTILAVHTYTYVLMSLFLCEVCSWGLNSQSKRRSVQLPVQRMPVLKDPTLAAGRLHDCVGPERPSICHPYEFLPILG